MSKQLEQHVNTHVGLPFHPDKVCVRFHLVCARFLLKLNQTERGSAWNQNPARGSFLLESNQTEKCILLFSFFPLLPLHGVQLLGSFSTFIHSWQEYPADPFKKCLFCWTTTFVVRIPLKRQLPANRQTFSGSGSGSGGCDFDPDIRVHYYYHYHYQGTLSLSISGYIIVIIIIINTRVLCHLLFHFKLRWKRLGLHRNWDLVQHWLLLGSDNTRIRRFLLDGELLSPSGLVWPTFQQLTGELLWKRRHFRQLRTSSHDNHSGMTIKSDIGQYL